MRAGRRFRGGGGGRRLTEELRRVIKLHRNDYSTVDDLVERIRRYQNYSRMSLKKLSRDVALILQEEESLESSGSRSRKKMKTFVDENEEKLQRIENNYAKNLQLDGLESESEDSESESDSEFGPSSTSVDEEPKFDLMKSMLRETYSAKAAKVKETENEKEKNIKIELSTPKKKMINGRSKGEDSL